MRDSSTVVFVRIFGSGSFCSWARCCSSALLTVRAAILGTTVSTLLRARSRVMGSGSLKHSCRLGNTLCSTVCSLRAAAKASMCCSSCRRKLASFDANIFATAGTRCFSLNSSSLTFLQIPRTGLRAFGGAAPYARAETQAGSTLRTRRILGSPRRVCSRPEKNLLFSLVSLSTRESRNSMMSFSLVWKNSQFCSSRWGLGRRPGLEASSAW
mmetsp:Transcript_27565/g.77017  ORF Transcript_27565/g.77017 Transcript_27565/m.77017 type:complete len:212 (-) Transcript_27565:662-1297(-)